MGCSAYPGALRPAPSEGEWWPLRTLPLSSRPASVANSASRQVLKGLPHQPVLSLDVLPAAQRRRGQLLPAGGPGEGRLRLPSKLKLITRRVGETCRRVPRAPSLRAARVRVTKGVTARSRAIPGALPHPGTSLERPAGARP